MELIGITNSQMYRNGVLKPKGYDYHKFIKAQLSDDNIKLTDEQIDCFYNQFKKFGKDALERKFDELADNVYTILSWQLELEVEVAYEAKLKEWYKKLVKHFENSFRYSYPEDLVYRLEDDNNQKYQLFLIDNPKPVKVRNYYELNIEERKSIAIVEITKQFKYDNTYAKNVYSKYVDGSVSSITTWKKEPNWFETFNAKHGLLGYKSLDKYTAEMFLNNVIAKYKMTIDKTKFVVVNNYELEAYSGCTIDLITAVRRSMDYNNKLQAFINDKLKDYGH